MLNEFLKYADNGTITIDFKTKRFELGNKYGASFDMCWSNGISKLYEVLEDMKKLNILSTDEDIQLQYYSFLERSFSQDSIGDHDMEVIDFEDIIKHDIKFTTTPTFRIPLIYKNLELRAEGVNTTQTYKDFESMVDDLKNYYSIMSYGLSVNNTYKLRGWMKYQYIQELESLFKSNSAIMVRANDK